MREFGTGVSTGQILRGRSLEQLAKITGGQSKRTAVVLPPLTTTPTRSPAAG
jgi:hypothetical protein